MICEHRKSSSSSSSWIAFGSNPSYFNGYAECSSWTKGNPDYNIRLTLNGKPYYTNENDAIENGRHPNSGISYMLDDISIAA